MSETFWWYPLFPKWRSNMGHWKVNFPLELCSLNYWDTWTYSRRLITNDGACNFQLKYQELFSHKFQKLEKCLILWRVLVMTSHQFIDPQLQTPGNLLIWWKSPVARYQCLFINHTQILKELLVILNPWRISDINYQQLLCYQLNVSICFILWSFQGISLWKLKTLKLMRHKELFLSFTSNMTITFI